MNYAALKKTDVANGPGVRVSLFVSGCTHACKGCFNREAWHPSERESLPPVQPGFGEIPSPLAPSEADLPHSETPFPADHMLYSAGILLGGLRRNPQTHQPGGEKPVALVDHLSAKPRIAPDVLSLAAPPHLPQKFQHRPPVLRLQRFPSQGLRIRGLLTWESPGGRGAPYALGFREGILCVF